MRTDEESVEKKAFLVFKTKFLRAVTLHLRVAPKQIRCLKMSFHFRSDQTFLTFLRISGWFPNGNLPTAKNKAALAGLEPAASALGGRRAIHCATGLKQRRAKKSIVYEKISFVYAKENQRKPRTRAQNIVKIPRLRKKPRLERFDQF